MLGTHTAAGALAAEAPTESPSDDNRKLVNDWLKVCKAHAEAYIIHPAQRPTSVFKLLPSPIFRHSQPVRGDDIGAVWLWVDANGRPAVVGTVFAYSDGTLNLGYRQVAHEFHSLSDEPIVATWRNKKQWSPNKPGLEWKPMPGAPKPANSPAQRVRQMRELARQFQAHEFDFRQGRWELRLVPKPVFRYEPKTTEAVQDGALFVFCQGTDPEIFLGIEARRTKGGYQWHYSCAAFSDYNLHVRHQETEVWNPPAGTYDDRRAPHWWNGAIETTKLP